MGKRNAQLNGLRCVVDKTPLTGQQQKFCSQKCMRDYWRPPTGMPAGRPSKFEKNIINKLEEVFAIGGSDAEACFYADISTTALYNYQKDHPEFVERKRQLKERPTLLARQSVVKGIEKDPDLAFKYLERKRKDEFATKPPPGAPTEGNTIIFMNNVPVDGPATA